MTEEEIKLMEQELEGGEDIIMSKYSNIQTKCGEIDKVNDEEELKLLINDCLFVQNFVETQQLFSTNETIEDYITYNIMFLAVPYYLSELYLRAKTNGPDERLAMVLRTKALINGFIEDGVRLDLITGDEKISIENDISDPEAKRNDKILRYRREKEIQEKLKQLVESRRTNYDLTPDEEFEREVSILVVRSCLLKSINSMALMKQEEELLQTFVNMQKEGKTLEPPIEDQNRPFQKPIVIKSKREIIKETMLQPTNLPTVSVEEAGEYDLQECLEREERQKQFNDNKIVQEYQETEEQQNEREVYKKNENLMTG